MKKQMKIQQGFTLIELLVVVIIIAIIAVLAVPNIRTGLAKQNLERSSRDLAFALDRARTKAVLERRTVTVNLSSASGTTADTASSITWQPSGNAVQTSSVSNITFRIDGLVQTSSTDTNPVPQKIDIKLCDSLRANTKTVTVDRMGNISQSAMKGGC